MSMIEKAVKKLKLNDDLKQDDASIEESTVEKSTHDYSKNENTDTTLSTKEDVINEKNVDDSTLVDATVKDLQQINTNDPDIDFNLNNEDTADNLPIVNQTNESTIDDEFLEEEITSFDTTTFDVLNANDSDITDHELLSQDNFPKVLPDFESDLFKENIETSLNSENVDEYEEEIEEEYEEEEYEEDEDDEDDDNTDVSQLDLEDTTEYEYEDEDSTEIDFTFEKIDLKNKQDAESYLNDEDNTDITDLTDITNSRSIDDLTDFEQEDTTNIQGFEGFKLKSKRSKHSNNVHIDLDRMDNLGFITPKHPDTMLTSVFRRIKRPILDNAANINATVVENSNLIMVTSSVANEGKTYCSTNLAISIAMEKDLNVLFIDADIKKPSLAKTFDLKPGKGLTDVLMGDVEDLSEVLHNTNIPSLTIMFAGTLHPNGTELLSSETMKKFAHEVSTRYPNRIVIFDSPPLLQTTESSVLSSHMGQVALVVEAEKTKAPQVRKSLHLINSEIKLLILNKQREKKNDLEYGYGYGY